jgi:hypothetical protein
MPLWKRGSYQRTLEDCRCLAPLGYGNASIRCAGTAVPLRAFPAVMGILGVEKTSSAPAVCPIYLVFVTTLEKVVRLRIYCDICQRARIIKNRGKKIVII